MVVAEVLDFPGVCSQGFDLADARVMIASVLGDVAQMWIEEGRAPPMPRWPTSWNKSKSPSETATVTERTYPRKYSSTAAAACRPSAIAHTTSDCPRRASPAANTPGIDVW